MTPTTKDVLVEAKRLLVEKGHTKGMFARDAQGYMVHATSEKAVCYCAFGALRAGASRLVGESACNEWIMKAVDALEAQGAKRLIKFNDSHTTEDVLALFDKTIAATP